MLTHGEREALKRRNSDDDIIRSSKKSFRFLYGPEPDADLTSGNLNDDNADDGSDELVVPGSAADAIRAMDAVAQLKRKKTVRWGEEVEENTDSKRGKDVPRSTVRPPPAKGSKVWEAPQVPPQFSTIVSKPASGLKPSASVSGLPSIQLPSPVRKKTLPVLNTKVPSILRRPTLPQPISPHILSMVGSTPSPSTPPKPLLKSSSSFRASMLSGDFFNSDSSKSSPERNPARSPAVRGRNLTASPHTNSISLLSPKSLVPSSLRSPQLISRKDLEQAFASTPSPSYPQQHAHEQQHLRAQPGTSTPSAQRRLLHSIKQKQPSTPKSPPAQPLLQSPRPELAPQPSISQPTSRDLEALLDLSYFPSPSEPPPSPPWKTVKLQRGSSGAIEHAPDSIWTKHLPEVRSPPKLTNTFASIAQPEPEVSTTPPSTTPPVTPPRRHPPPDISDIASPAIIRTPSAPLQAPRSINPSPQTPLINVEAISPPPTPPFDPNAVALAPEEIERALEEALVPWPELPDGVLSARKVARRVEKGRLALQVTPESALHRLIRAQKLWTDANVELFKLKHPSGLPRDHKTSKFHYIDDGQPLRGIHLLSKAILLDPRVIAFKTPEERRDFESQIVWQTFYDALHVGWVELADILADLDYVFEKAEARSQPKAGILALISTRRALASFIRCHLAAAILQEQDGATQAAILKYGRVLDIIEWVKVSLRTIPNLGDDRGKRHYGLEGDWELVEDVFEPVFARGVQIRLGWTLIAQYASIKRTHPSLRYDIIAALFSGSADLQSSCADHVMTPSHHRGDLKLDVFVSDYVYHLAHSFYFQGFYHRENAALILEAGQPSPRGGRPADVVAKERRGMATYAFAQATMLYPEDEEVRTGCCEEALEEALKMGGLRVGEAVRMFEACKESHIKVDAVWAIQDEGEFDEEEPEDEPVSLLFTQDPNEGSKKKKKKKKKKKESSDPTPKNPPQPIPAPGTPALGTPRTPALGTPRTPSLGTPRLTNTPGTPRRGPKLTRDLSIWFNSLQRSLDEKRIMTGDILHAISNLKGRPEVVWNEDSVDDEDWEDGVSRPWASWGMRMIKATKWDDLIKGDDKSSGPSKKAKKKAKPQSATPSTALALLPSILAEKPAAVAASADEPNTNAVVQEEDGPSPMMKPVAVQLEEETTAWAALRRLTKQKLFVIDLDVFDDGTARAE